MVSAGIDTVIFSGHIRLVTGGQLTHVENFFKKGYAIENRVALKNLLTFLKVIFFSQNECCDQLIFTSNEEDFSPWSLKRHFQNTASNIIYGFWL